MAVEDEDAWFDNNRAYIASQYPGQYVVIKGHAVRGAYPDFKSAVKAAVNSFGPNGGFAVKQALPEEPVQKIGSWAS